MLNKCILFSFLATVQIKVGVYKDNNILTQKLNMLR